MSSSKSKRRKTAWRCLERVPKPWKPHDLVLTRAVTRDKSLQSRLRCINELMAWQVIRHSPQEQAMRQQPALGSGKDGSHAPVPQDSIKQSADDDHAASHSPEHLQSAPSKEVPPHLFACSCDDHLGKENLEKLHRSKSFLAYHWYL